MVKRAQAPPAVKAGAQLTVSWKTRRSNTWRPYEDSVGRAILAAAASGKATCEIDEELEESPSQQKKRPRSCRRSNAELQEKRPRSVTFDTMREGTLAESGGVRSVRWSISPTCSFDRLPTDARALAALIAGCGEVNKRQVLSAVLDHLTSKERIKSFLSKIPPTFGPDISGARFKDVRVNKLARAGSPLYERFLDAMVRHVADLGEAFQAYMGSESQSIQPLKFAFHGTPASNIPSILKSGMLPEKRRSSGDWFSTEPHVSTPYCRQPTCLPPFRMILFLLLPLGTAVIQNYGWNPVVVMADPHYELPLCSVKYFYEMNLPNK